MSRELPYIDTHTVTVAASPEAAFDAVVRTLPRAGARGPASVYARMVGCEDGKPFAIAGKPATG